ncbi:hypothetical protein [Geodermatophilus sp. FMUSA9-8]|uniref:hypothetical protein n=1 Tax=Geodermatophilus sp. FMUSA9-8 TaxID=3120155 RepID=UPI00300BC016
MDPDARFASLVEALATRPGVGPPGASGRRGFGSAALTVHGSIFAMVVGGALVLKLPAHRVEGLVTTGTGLPFAAANGTPMREWVALDHGTPASDLALAEEAMAFVASRATRGG